LDSHSLEQGGELVHSTISKYEIRAGGIRNIKLKMKNILESNLINTDPKVSALSPPVRNRKRKAEWM
jgi:hypothetical protein